MPNTPKSTSLSRLFFSLFRCEAALLVFLLIGKLSLLAQPTALPKAFAHNDYRHKHPFYDAFQQGFTYLESDIYLRQGRLLVSHSLPFFKGKRTLERLYLQPLQAYFDGRQNTTPTAMDTLVLMIDVKSGGERTFAALKAVLEKYAPLLSSWENGTMIKRQLTIVLSGHRPLSVLRNAQTRFFFVDENLPQVNEDEGFNSMYAMASCKYSKVLKWKGKGCMPEKERKGLCALVSKAHLFGKKVRLWASPENEAVWKELLNCGVDLINTDRLEAFRRFSAQPTIPVLTLEEEQLWIP